MEENIKLNKKGLFNPSGDISINAKAIVNGTSTNINDLNNIKYKWVSNWYRQAISNFWIPEEVNMNQDIKDYRKSLTIAERRSYNKTLSFLIYLDSLQTLNLPNINEYISAQEVSFCINLQCFQEDIHSQSYAYVLDTICSPDERNSIIYDFKNDSIMLKRYEFINGKYEEFIDNPNLISFIKVLVANYILEGLYFYTGFMFFYNLGRNSKMNGTAQIIRKVNKDENNHLSLFKNIILEFKKEHKEIFTPEVESILENMIKEACIQEIEWGFYIIGNEIRGLNIDMIKDYIKYLGNIRATSIGLKPIFEGHLKEPLSMSWVSNFSKDDYIKLDNYGNSSLYSKSSTLKDDL